jgi:hypothetical protein
MPRDRSRHERPVRERQQFGEPHSCLRTVGKSLGHGERRARFYQPPAPVSVTSRRSQSMDTMSAISFARPPSSRAEATGSFAPGARPS